MLVIITYYLLCESSINTENIEDIFAIQKINLLLLSSSKNWNRSRIGIDKKSNHNMLLSVRSAKLISRKNTFLYKGRYIHDFEAEMTFKFKFSRAQLSLFIIYNNCCPQACLTQPIQLCLQKKGLQRVFFNYKKNQKQKAKAFTG